MIFKIENKRYGDSDLEKSSDRTIFSDPKKKSRNFDLLKRDQSKDLTTFFSYLHRFGC